MIGDPGADVREIFDHPDGMLAVVVKAGDERRRVVTRAEMIDEGGAQACQRTLDDLEAEIDDRPPA